jgi:uracil-DNA glycosylase
MFDLKINKSWSKALDAELNSKYMLDLEKFLVSEKKLKKNIFPEQKNILYALDQTPLEKVKVVILGQDPYHGLGQAHGLSFSVQAGVKLPPSLVNIYKELQSDLEIPISTNGDLSAWAEQGVLLLNSVLTVEQDKAASHQGKGWEKFTDQIISAVNENNETVVFILWGSYAQKKAAFVDRKKHLVLESVHPSPLSSYRGFFGSKPFSKANAYLKKHGKKEIVWKT